MDLRKATTDEINAAFDAVKGDIEQLIATMIPSFFRGQAMQELNSSRGRQYLLDGVIKALNAAESVREATEAKATKAQMKGA